MMESLPGPLLKTDVLVRVKTPATRREQRLDEFGRSGTSGPKFAALVGVKDQTLATWMPRKCYELYCHPKTSLLVLAEVGAAQQHRPYLGGCAAAPPA